MNNLTTTKIRKSREAFDLYDQNKDGTIKKSDLIHVFRSLRYDPSENEIKELAAAMNYDQNDKISFEEFMKVIASYNNEFDVDDDEVFRCFEELDKPKKEGKINIEEFRKYLKLIKHNLNEEELDELFSEIDPDNTGFIDYHKLLNKERKIINSDNLDIKD